MGAAALAALEAGMIGAARRRVGDPLLARAATLGMFLILVALSGFALWSNQYTRQASERAIASSQLSDHYASAAAAVAAEESLERKYRLEPGYDVGRRFQKATAELEQAMDRVRRDGTVEDQAVARRVAAAYVPYLAAIDRMFAAADRGDVTEVLRIDGDEVDPKFDIIEHLVNGAADAHHQQQIAALADLQARENFNARATPVALAGGLLLVMLFSSVLRLTRAELDQQREQAASDALLDPLTRLPNRTLLADRFEQSLRAGQRDGTVTGLLLIDLDRFKEVNDTLGHHVGDQLLSLIGPRLSGALRAVDTVARLGGDEFAVLLPAVDGRNGALEVAARLRTALAQSFVVDGVALDIDASIGVAISGEHGDDPQTLLQRADVAMYEAKQQGRGVVVYDPENDTHSPERLALLGQLRRGIERGELFLHYQPKIKLGSGQLTGVEALVRWQHPERGLVPPDAFIPLAEHTGLIGPLTMRVLDMALAQARAWADLGDRIPVAINVSARNLLDEEFGDKVAVLLEKHGVPAELLEVEVTESAVMLEPERSGRILAQLDKMGVRIAIDDFGAGYTSLAQLRNLPVSELKIDRSFILSMHSDPDSALIVRSMIDLGHSLNLKVVAEGVETAQDQDTLTGYRCDSAQGYHLCRPVPAEAFMRWLGEHRKQTGAARVPIASTRPQPPTGGFVLEGM
jgi:diguanylate cyclase (GGDEF)-like protein